MMNAPTTTPERGEAEQQAGEEVDELADVLVVALRDLRRGRPPRRSGPDRRTQRTAELGAVHAGVAAHVDGVEPGRRRRRSRCDVGRSKASERRTARCRRLRRALNTPTSVERLGAVRPRARRPRRRRGTRRHGPCRGPSRPHRVRRAHGCAGAAVVDQQHRALVAPADERHAEPTTRPCRPLHRRGRRTARSPARSRAPPGHAVDRPHLVDDRVRNAGASSSPRTGAPAHDDVDVGQRLREHALERRVEGVGEHVRRGDERDAEEHRDGRERESELPGQHTPEGDLQHGRASRPRRSQDRNAVKKRGSPVAGRDRTHRPAAGIELLGVEELVQQLDRDRALARPPTPPASPSRGGRRRPRTRRACSSRARAVGGRAARHSRRRGRPPVRTNPRSSRAISAGSQSVCGRAPIMRKSPSAPTVSSLPVSRFAQHEVLEATVPAAADDLGRRGGRRASVSPPPGARGTATSPPPSDLGPHDERDVRCVPGEVERGLPRRVRASDARRHHPARHARRLRRGAAVEHAGAVERLQLGDPDALVRGAGREQHARAPMRPLSERVTANPSSSRWSIGDALQEREVGAEDPRLLVRLLREPPAAHAAREPEVVADQRARGRLAADARPGRRPACGSPRTRRTPRRTARPGPAPTITRSNSALGGSTGEPAATHDLGVGRVAAAPCRSGKMTIGNRVPRHRVRSTSARPSLESASENACGIAQRPSSSRSS